MRKEGRNNYLADHIIIRQTKILKLLSHDTYLDSGICVLVYSMTLFQLFSLDRQIRDWL
jgi:hypothetical protein